MADGAWGQKCVTGVRARAPTSSLLSASQNRFLQGHMITAVLFHLHGSTLATEGLLS